MVGTLQRTPSTGCGPNGRPGPTAYTITINSQSSAASLDESFVPLTEGDKVGGGGRMGGGHHGVGGPPMIVGGGMGVGGGSGAAAASPGTIVNVSTASDSDVRSCHGSYGAIFPLKNVGHRHPAIGPISSIFLSKLLPQRFTLSNKFAPLMKLHFHHLYND